MKPNNASTARPWIARRPRFAPHAEAGYWEIEVASNNGFKPYVADVRSIGPDGSNNSEANADLIVRAVNAHDALVAALDMLHTALMQEPGSQSEQLAFAFQHAGYVLADVRGVDGPLLAKARAALAAAREGGRP